MCHKSRSRSTSAPFEQRVKCVPWKQEHERTGSLLRAGLGPRNQGAWDESGKSFVRIQKGKLRSWLPYNLPSTSFLATMHSCEHLVPVATMHSCEHIFPVHRSLTGVRAHRPVLRAPRRLRSAAVRERLHAAALLQLSYFTHAILSHI